MRKKNKILFWFFLLLIPTVFFGFSSGSLAEEDELIISEIMYDPEGTDTGKTDWIEIYNPTDKKITLKKDEFGLIDEEELELGKDGKHYLNCHGIKKDLEVSPGSFAIIADSESEFKNSYPDLDDISLYDSTFNLSSGGDSIRLSDDKCQTFFAEISFKKSWGASNNGRTLENKDLKNKYDEDDWQESYVSGGTPGNPSSKKPKPKDYKGKVRISEVLPSPLKGEKEFVEIINLDDMDIDFSKWYIKDEKNNKKSLSEGKSKDMFFFKYDSFSLNSEGDSLYLFDESGILVDSIKYVSSKTGYSYAFDGSKWRWTKYTTPGQENQFETPLPLSAKKDKKIYKNTYADFEAKTSKNTKKVVWDFGDGHKSYLKNTRHKYEKTGTYFVTVKVSGDGEDTLETFAVEVKNYPKSDVEIISVLANPAGKDTLGEKMTIRNNSKKEVNLKNWSIATGTKNLVNHPITKDFKLKPGKSKEITRKYALFTLGNKVSKIELRMPNGKAIQKIKYDRKDDSISEDETYEKNEDGWGWNKPLTNVDETKTDADAGAIHESPLPPEEESAPVENTTDINLTQQEILSSIGKYSASPVWQEKQKNKIILLTAGTDVKPPEIFFQNQPQVLGAWTMKKSVPPKDSEEWWEDWWIKINSNLNRILNKI